ncbi:MAG TPA: penicillin acylase family protein [Pirellulales bacterium]|jgi:penicillin amidase|nr:penicillin acylase family protein [Pirellulales bacterium]
MNLSGAEILRRLGEGESIAALCAAAQMTRPEFDAWWRAEIERRLPSTEGMISANVAGNVEIVRDDRGIPHIMAARDEDLFYGFGLAMSQDRLFQLDYLRRRAWGRLCEILGSETMPLDLTARTMGLGAIAEAEWAAAGSETRRLLEAFSAGVNRVIEASAECLPIEFDLLDYRPQLWSPVDCLAIEGEFRWYLTGRLPVFAVPEMVRRTLGEGPLYQVFLRGEADDECILPAGSYPGARVGVEPFGNSAGDPTPCQGSNNWVIAGTRTTTGRPLLASDPHIAFGAVSCWYEVHLCGGSFNVAGMAYCGMPAVMFGRNERVAWGCTNNICAQRDLYQEKTDAAHPDCFSYDGRWESAGRRQETIEVKGVGPVTKTIRSSRHGPIVDELLPEATRTSEPVSVRWLGSEPCRCLEALLTMDRARSAEELREATRTWRVPTFSLVFCDLDGHIGYQSVGRVPIRRQPARGYRPGWDPEHEWQGLIPFEGMPRLADPPRGFAVTANNRPAPDDFPYPLAGVWVSGYRARRIRQMIEAKQRTSFDDLGRMQLDVLSLRAVECVPQLVALLERGAASPTAVEELRRWNCRMEPGSGAAAIFDVFFTHWCQAVAKERFAGEAASLVAAAAGGLAASLLRADEAGWFAPGRREAAVHQAFAAALETLAARLGPSLDRWQWSELHRMQVRHFLSERGDLGELLDQPSPGVHGDMLTVCNTGGDIDWQARLGAGYRMVVDMSVAPAEMWAVDAGSESGHPASPHYGDQLGDWITGRYHRLPLDRAPVEGCARSRLILTPAQSSPGTP